LRHYTRRILRGRSAEWVGGREGTTLDEADLAVIEANTSAMRSWSDTERRLVQASRAARELREYRRQRLQGEALLRSIGHSAGPIGRVELGALWELAGLTEESERTRFLLLAAALDGRGRAEQLANRLEPVVHAAVGLCPARRQAVVSEIVLPVLRGVEVDPVVRWTATRIGLFLRASGDEFVALAGEALVGYIEQCEGPVDPEAAPLARLLPSSVAEKAAGTAADRLIRSSMSKTGDSATPARILAAIVAHLPSEKLERAAVYILTQLWVDISTAQDPAERDRLAGSLRVVAGRIDYREIRRHTTSWVKGLDRATRGSVETCGFVLEAMLDGLSDSNAESCALEILAEILKKSNVLDPNGVVGLASRMAHRLAGPAAKQAVEIVLEAFCSRSVDDQFVECLGAVLGPIMVGWIRRLRSRPSGGPSTVSHSDHTGPRGGTSRPT